VQESVGSVLVLGDMSIEICMNLTSLSHLCTLVFLQLVSVLHDEAGHSDMCAVD
jgi:hypothetical protein